MAEIATQDQFVNDVNGIRRLVRGGQPVPVGLFEPGAVEVNRVETRSLAKPVIDEEASKPAGTAAEPDAGVSFEHAEAVQADARSQGEQQAEQSSGGSRSSRRSRQSEDS